MDLLNSPKRSGKADKTLRRGRLSWLSRRSHEIAGARARVRDGRRRLSLRSSELQRVVRPHQRVYKARREAGHKKNDCEHVRLQDKTYLETGAQTSEMLRGLRRARWAQSGQTIIPKVGWGLEGEDCSALVQRAAVLRSSSHVGGQVIGCRAFGSCSVEGGGCCLLAAAASSLGQLCDTKLLMYVSHGQGSYVRFPDKFVQRKIIK
eukprot:2866473-Pleurochrysis_carterae.AAC.1